MRKYSYGSEAGTEIDEEGVVSGALIRLKLEGHSPRFPDNCVVCARPARGEKALVNAWSESPLAASMFMATRDFLVPMHAQGCQKRYAWKAYVAKYGVLGFGLLAFVMSVAAHFVFTTIFPLAPLIFAGAFVVGLPLTLYVQSKMPITIYESFTQGVYKFFFTSTEMARQFQELNQESVD